jgi:hypothetical protein
MAPIPQIQIQVNPLVMEFQTTPAKVEMEQTQAQVNYNNRPLRVDLQVVSKGELSIDQQRAWEAVGLGGSMFFAEKIYSHSKQIVLQSIARMVEDGNRMAQVTKGTVIHQLHEGKPLTAIPFDYFSTASIDNVDIQYQPKQIKFQVDPGELSFDVQLNPPRFDVTYPKFEAYVKQHSSVEIIPPAIDVKW